MTTSFDCCWDRVLGDCDDSARELEEQQHQRSHLLRELGWTESRIADIHAAASAKVERLRARAQRRKDQGKPCDPRCQCRHYERITEQDSYADAIRALDHDCMNATEKMMERLKLAQRQYEREMQMLDRP